MQIKLPQLGDGIDSVKVIRVAVSEGDSVSPDTVVIEVETDKTTMEIPAETSGTILKALFAEGDTLTPGQALFEISADAKDATAPPSGEPKEPAKAEAQPSSSSPSEVQEVTVTLPGLGEGIDQVKVIEVHLKPQDLVEENTTLISVETDKTTMDIPTEHRGTLLEVLVQEGDSIRSGAPLARIASTTKVATASTPVNEVSEEQKQSTSDIAPKFNPPSQTIEVTKEIKPIQPGRLAPAAPSVRRLARELGVDINEVVGSGSGGRINLDDVKKHTKQIVVKKSSEGFAGGLGYSPIKLPDFSKFGSVRREEMSGIRKATLKNMAQAWSTIPMVTQFDKADITDIEALRKQLNQRYKGKRTKLTITAILLKIVGSALKKFPNFNASIDLNQQEIVFKEYFHVGIAVDTPKGLLVPVVRDVDQKNVFELADDLDHMAKLARDRKLKLEDMQGASTTITNLGGIGGHSFTPIVNPPEVSILGVSRASMEPIYQDGNFVPRLMMPLVLTYDHRLIDGADAARFLRFICDLVQNPALIMFEG